MSNTRLVFLNSSQLQLSSRSSRMLYNASRDDTALNNKDLLSLGPFLGISYSNYISH